MNKTIIKNKLTTPTNVMGAILQEVRELRKDILFFLPQDDIGAYTHPQRIKRSYQRALKLFPPASWK